MNQVHPVVDILSHSDAFDKPRAALNVVRNDLEEMLNPESTHLGIDLPDGLPFEHWAQLTTFWLNVDRRSRWVLADLLNYGEKSYGDTYTQALPATGLKIQSLMDVKWVGSKYEISRRREISFEHHRVVAKLEPDESDAWLSLAEEHGWNLHEFREQVRKTTGQLMVQSDNNEWYTPKGYMNSVHEVMGGIDLDPASCADANKIVGAERFYTIDDDGLSQPWSGRVFLNPPYGRLAGEFVTRLVNEYDTGNVGQAIALVNAHCTDTHWFQHLWNGVLCFTDHRIDFYRPDSKTHNQSTHGSVFAYFGKHDEHFSAVFSEYGEIVRRWPQW